MLQSLSHRQYSRTPCHATKIILHKEDSPVLLLKLLVPLLHPDGKLPPPRVSSATSISTSHCDVPQNPHLPDPTAKHAICSVMVGVARDLDILPWRAKCAPFVAASTSHRSKISGIVVGALTIYLRNLGAFTLFLNDDARCCSKPAR
jgi:hypothetical protein